jgi:protein arginine phosphatase
VRGLRSHTILPQSWPLQLKTCTATRLANIQVPSGTADEAARLCQTVSRRAAPIAEDFSHIDCDPNILPCLDLGQRLFDEMQRQLSGVIRKSAMKIVLFVCSGNAGRSPAAEYLARQYIDDRKISVQVRSRGTNVRGHSTTDPQLITAVPAAKSHVPTGLDEDIIQSADLILTMNRQHKQIVTTVVPSAADKTYCLYEYAEGTAKAVIDPGDFDQED